MVRPIEPGDTALLAAGVDGFSPETMRRRFLAPKHGLTLAELRYLTDVDFIDHYALVAVHRDEPRRLAGVARWVRDKRRPRGRRDGDRRSPTRCRARAWAPSSGCALVDAALRHGVQRFTATMLAENVAARQLFGRISHELHTHVEHGTLALVADLAA